MLSVYRTLSLRYFAKRWFRKLLIVAAIALGVATLVASRALNDTMTRAATVATNPMASISDLVVTNGEIPIDRELADRLRKIPGVQHAFPRVFESVILPDHDNRSVLLLGLNVLEESKVWADRPAESEQIQLSADTHQSFLLAYAMARTPAVVGKELNVFLGKEDQFRVQSGRGKAKTPLVLTRAGTVAGTGIFAFISGDTLIVDLDVASHIVGLKGQVKRIDVILESGATPSKVKKRIAAAIGSEAFVRTPEEQNEAMQSAMTGMQTGFALCGWAALVVGLFLVYMVLSVVVAERRHEIGVLRSLGATKLQIYLLFGGESVLLGLLGSGLGIPLGVGLAYIGLQPVQDVLRDIFHQLEAKQIEVNTQLVVFAMIAGTCTAVFASLLPVVRATSEKPADAVRRVPQQVDWRHRFPQIAISGFLIFAGVALVIFREFLPHRLGTYGGMMMVLLGALVAAPLLAALIARMIQPFFRHWLSIEWRLAADNFVRSPGRTGLVVAALAAGVALIMQTAGTILSNRVAMQRWTEDYIAADLKVSAGSPVSVGGSQKPMDAELREKIEQIPGVDGVAPWRSLKVPFQNTQIMLYVVDADVYYRMDSKRGLRKHTQQLFRKLSEERDAAIVSQNFAVNYRIKNGDTIELPGGRTLRVLGQIEDYSWNRGVVFVNWRPNDPWEEASVVDAFDVYVTPGADAQRVKQTIEQKYGAVDLHVLNREQLQDQIQATIERLYNIAYAQQIVVVLVAALGVVTALLISVLQRRQEMGLLRAIGASRVQVVRSVLAEACLMGVIGTFIGILAGIPMEWFIVRVVFFEESGYLFPMLIAWREALIIGVAAMVIATLAGMGPALYAVRQRIPEAIAYE